MSERPKSEVSARQLGKLVLRAAPILGAGLVLAAACKGSEEVTQTPTTSATPDKNLSLDPLINCPAEAKLTEPEPGDEVWPDLLAISFPGDTVPGELQAVIDERDLCFFTYVPANDADPNHLLWLDDPSQLHEVKAKLDSLVESGVIISVDFEGISHFQESAQASE